MRFDELVKAVLDMPPGSIVFAKRTDEEPTIVPAKAEFEIENVNGQDVRDAN